MSKSLESLSIIASEICEDIGDSTEFHHMRIMRKLKEGYQQLYWYIIPELDSIEGEIFPNNGQVQYELPCNFVYETKVGILKNGILVTLDLKKDLRLRTNKSTDTQAICDINGYFDGSLVATEFMPFYNLYRTGNWVGEMYGFGCGFHSNQWYNIKDGVLEVGSLIPDDAEIVVEFKSNGIPKDGLKLVPSETVPAIKDWAKGRFYEDSKPGLAVTFDEKWKVKYFKLKKLYSFRSPEYLAWLWKSEDHPAHY